MSSIVKLSYEDFVAILSIDEATVGNYLGISDRAKLVWTFAIYLGTWFSLYINIELN